MGELRRLLVIIRFVRAIEPRRGVGININRDVRTAGKSLLHPRDRLRRDLRIVLGKVDDERTANPRDEVQAEINAKSAIRNGAIDTSFNRREIGELAAEPEAEGADLPGAFAAGAQGRGGGHDVPDPVGERGDLGTEHDIALGGVKIAELAQFPVIIRDIGEYQQPRSITFFRDRDVGAPGCDVDKMSAHGDLPL